MTLPSPADAGRKLWLLTPRCTPAWHAVLHLLDDDQWHATTDVAQAMRNASDLADSTIHNQLREAGRRQWISNKRGRTRLRNRELIEAALSTADGSRP
jgi:hypothetical protein